MGSLADRLRPQSFSEFVGQEHLLAEGRILWVLRQRKKPISLILWGPPGSGKTTLAYLLGKELQANFVSFSAVDISLKDLKDIIAQAKRLKGLKQETIVFIDEIHRFNKSQQAFLLPYVERGDIYLIGATTENPSFEIIPPLLSRTKVLLLEPLKPEEIKKILERALEHPLGLKEYNVKVEDEVLWSLANSAHGDARFALNTLEILVEKIKALGKDKLELSDITPEVIKKPLVHDKEGEAHYNLLSAFHKSMRGSDPDASIYWLARLLKAGEDPEVVARRIIACAAEDVGLADPMALVVAVSALLAYQALGSPEGDLALALATLYNALSEKSNSAYLALKSAQALVEEKGDLSVPLHLRNPVTKLMESLGYGRDYFYPHDFEEGFVPQDYLPEEIKDKTFYHPKDKGKEVEFKERLKKLWAKKKK